LNNSYNLIVISLFLYTLS